MGNRLRLLAFLAMACAAFLQSPADLANSAEPTLQDAPTPDGSRQTPSTLDTVTVRARKDREIRREITKYVTGNVVTYRTDSLEQWTQPICPLVAGTAEQAEFIRERVSEVAKDSNVPLAGEHCRPNLVVVISNDPDVLVEGWHKRIPALLNVCNGLGPVRNFLHSQQPVRVFYNAKFIAAAGQASPGDLVLEGASSPMMPTHSDCEPVTPLGTYLHHGAVQSLSSVIIVVDRRQIAKITTRQLADYVAMIGLSQIRVRPDSGAAPSILHLFQGPDPQPAALSPWDTAFLRSLYTTDQSSVLEVPIIEDRMFQQIVSH